MNVISYCTKYYLLLRTKKLNTVNNIGVLLKGVLFDLRARKFVVCTLVTVRAICRALVSFELQFFYSLKVSLESLT